MTLFSDIVQAHAAADQTLRQRIGQAQDVGDDVRPQEPEVPLSLMLEVNDNAYFFLIFARFEAAIKRMTGEKIRSTWAQFDSSSTQSWVLKKIAKVPFLEHLALLTDKDGSDYGDVQKLYKDRNAIAHGSFAGTGLNVSAIAGKLNGILARLEGTP